jgi:hypothetical protein
VKDVFEQRFRTGAAGDALPAAATAPCLHLRLLPPPPQPLHPPDNSDGGRVSRRMGIDVDIAPWEEWGLLHGARHRVALVPAVNRGARGIALALV